MQSSPIKKIVKTVETTLMTPTGKTNKDLTTFNNVLQNTVTEQQVVKTMFQVLMYLNT